MTSPAEPRSWTDQVLALFETALEGVLFPGVDHETLSAGRERTASAQAKVEECRRALEEARAEQERERASLDTLAQRALEYARIYAADDAALLEQIEAVQVPGPTRRKKTKARTPKKPKKSSAPAESQLALAKEDAA